MGDDGNHKTTGQAVAVRIQQLLLSLLFFFYFFIIFVVVDAVVVVVVVEDIDIHMCMLANVRVLFFFLFTIFDIREFYEFSY